MKKSTGIVFLIAAALAAFVYFYDWKHNPSSTESTADTSKPAFTLASTDVNSMQIDRVGASSSFEHRADGWYITKPVTGKADSSILDGIASELSSVRVDRTFPATPDNLKSFGLDDPAVTLDFTLKNGAHHTLQLGKRDFSGASVYARADGSANVDLMADTILTSSDKNLDDLRDHTVVSGDVTEATAFTLSNSSGEISAIKMGQAWKIVKPHPADADPNVILTLLGVLGSGQITHFVADSDKNLAQYGLTHPDIAFKATLPGGGTTELQVGKKEGDEYDARDLSRPLIFRINDNVHKNLASTFFDIRDKSLTHLTETDVTHAELHNQSGATTCTQDSGGTLMLDQPAGSKAPASECPNFAFSIEAARATAIYDTPPADISAKLAKPLAQVTFTPKSGQPTQFRFSPVTGDSVYAQIVGSPTIYKLDKKIADDLSAKPPDAK